MFKYVYVLLDGGLSCRFCQVAFTGSSATGKKVMAAAAQVIKVMVVGYMIEMGLGSPQ